MIALFLLIQLFWPLCCLLAWAFGLEFHIHSEAVYFILLTTASLLLWKKAQGIKTLWVMLLFPVTVLACSAEILLMKSVLAIPSAVVRCGCAYAALIFLPDKWYTYLTKGICTLLAICMAGLCFFDLTFGRIGKTTVVQEAPSPDGTCTAQLIDDDQGALGGSTLVRIVLRDTLPLGFAGFRPMTRTIYRSSWGEFESMTLSWQDGNTLLINETPYPIS